MLTTYRALFNLPHQVNRNKKHCLQFIRLKCIFIKFLEDIDIILSVGTQAQGLKMKKFNPIHFRETYKLGQSYPEVKSRARSSLKKYFDIEELYSWDDGKKGITFTSERLIPAHPIGKPRVMLLFSNPHPRSVQMGMFHSFKLPNAFPAFEQ